MSHRSASATSATAALRQFFGVVGKPRTYGNLAYLLLAFPLAIFYTVFLSVGYSLGFGLAIVAVGVPILVGMVLATGALVAVERELAVHLLGVEAGQRPTFETEDGLLSALGDWLTSESFWRGLGLLGAKCAFGMVAFVATVTLLATSFALLAAPLEFLGYAWVDVQVGGWVIDTAPEAAVAALVGFLLTFASLHALNLLAQSFGRLATWLLGPAASADESEADAGSD